MGRHPGEIVADIDWDETGHGPVTGIAKLKMLKTFTYPIITGSEGTMADDKSFHVYAKLQSQFGNGSLDCNLDVSPDGTIHGTIPLLKKVVLVFDGHLR